MTNEEAELFETCRDYFENEYTNLAENTLSIIQSVVTQMTQFFYTDPDVRSSFCAPIEELNFLGFKEVIDKGKIVILKMNIAQYRNLAKTIAAYMKLDFQDEVMQRLIRDDANKSRPVFMVSDEYQEFVTATDAEFYAQSREPKCCTIVATQSYTSLINTLKDKDTVRTVTQNLINKIWLRTDDLFTVEEAQKQLGKEDKEKITKSISESSGDVTKSRILGTLVSDKSSISESVNVNTVKEFVFDETLFTQHLDVFTGVAFLSDGAKIIEPSVVHLQPYFGENITKNIRFKTKKALAGKQTI
jgi:type IV secretory pathway TraG/TraD family ATPase VirD4